MNKEMIESFLTIVRLQTISAAAEAMFISQSTLSHRLQMLEQELHVQLFERQRGFKQMILTESGQQFIPYAYQLLDLEQAIHQTLGSPSLGRLVIASMDSVNQYLLADMFALIKQQHSEIQMEFVSYHSQEIYSRLLSRQIDIGFAFYPVHYELTSVPVFDEPMVMICPPGSGYPAGSIHPKVLKKSDEVFFAWNAETEVWNNTWWDEMSAPFVKVDSTALMMAFLRQPGLWAVCPASVATHMAERGRVEVHPFSETPPHRICYMLQRKSASGYTPKAVQLFVEAFFSQLSGHSWRYEER